MKISEPRVLSNQIIFIDEDLGTPRVIINFNITVAFPLQERSNGEARKCSRVVRLLLFVINELLQRHFQ